MSHKQNDIWYENLSELTGINKIVNDSQNETLRILNSMTSNKCEFCDSVETTKYPAEGNGDIYLCEDCHSIGQDDR